MSGPNRTGGGTALSAERIDNPTGGNAAVSDAVLIAVARREAEAATRARSHRTASRTSDTTGSSDDSVRVGQRRSSPATDEVTSAGEAFDRLSTLPTPPPDSFAGYQIVREIHRGGQGVVYQAIQESTKRTVALKVLKEGAFASPGEQARFEREVEILSQLNHPNIVAIYDSAQAAGRHYFVMDYIRGAPLDTWLANGAHSQEQTLELFAKICGAVNAAHLRGITHRDLKPGNIRVDDGGEPHILDFGLARMALGLGGQDSAAPAMTMTGQFIGSLPWASPEQAEGVPSKVDLRTDVYSLGVILYQMLTGQFPYKVTGNMHDVLDRIMRTEPVRPSSINKHINDEVETIVLKCLNKERERRYQSAGELARDIGRYLAGEPIEAKRDSALYILRKQLGRYRLPVAVGAAFLVVLVAGAVTSLALWRQAVAERGNAESRRAAAEASEATALAETARADREAAAARKQATVAELERSLFSEVLARANRGGQPGDPNVAVREIMDRATQELATARVRYEPEVEAAVRTTLGRTYVALGLFNQAEPHLRTALELRRTVFSNQHVSVAESAEVLAVLLQIKGDYAEAETLYREALQVRRALLGGPHGDVASSLNNLGGLLKDAGNYAESETLLTEALAMTRELHGDDNLDVATCMTSLAALLREKGDFAQAEALLRDALAITRRFRGEEHSDVAAVLSNLALVLSKQGDFTQAETLYRQALALQRRLLGDEHPSVAAIMSNLGALLQAESQYAEAESLLTAALDLDRRQLGNAHPAVASDLNNLAELRRITHDYTGAEPLYREALALQRTSLGGKHPAVATTLNNLGLLLLAKGDYGAAEPVLREALGLFRKQVGDEHPRVATTLNNLGRLLVLQHDDAGAEPLFREALAIDQVRPSPNVAVTACIGLGESLLRLGRWSDAEPVLLEAEQRSTTAQCPYTFRDGALSALSELYKRWHAAEPGKGYDRQAAAWSARRAEWKSSTQPAAPATERSGQIGE